LARLNAASERIFSLGPFVLRLFFVFAVVTLLVLTARGSALLCLLDAIDDNSVSSFPREGICKVTMEPLRYTCFAAVRNGLLDFA
jgi:hypothetical protein